PGFGGPARIPGLARQCAERARAAGPGAGGQLRQPAPAVASRRGIARCNARSTVTGRFALQRRSERGKNAPERARLPLAVFARGTLRMPEIPLFPGRWAGHPHETVVRLATPYKTGLRPSLRIFLIRQPDRGSRK